MRKLTAFLISFIILFVLSALSHGTAQYLVRIDNVQTGKTISLAFESRVYVDQGIFGLTPSLQPLNQSRLDYRVIDRDMEPGNYYLIENRFGKPMDLNDISSTNVKLLWRTEHLALMRREVCHFLKPFPENTRFDI